jgi:branched-chain amino acid transport system ATP-binding protein
MLAVGQALMQKPCVLLLDEPSSGQAPAIVYAAHDAIEQLVHQGHAVLVVEQIDRALASASRIYVMERGALKLESSA